jgi:deazaflavin-dependent oxidoreductase (nitroreductase family)
MQENPAQMLSQLAGEDYCYLTTRGRMSGQPHLIEIWFGTQGGSRIYLMAGNHRSDWVLNSLKEPNVTVRIAKHLFHGTVSLVKDEKEEMDARYLLAEKYQEWEKARTLSDWARTALVVAIDLSLAESE